MSIIPMADILNHSAHRAAAHLSDDIESLSESRRIFGAGATPEGTMVMRATSGIKKDREVFNTYGDLDNAQLLQRYGFVEEANRHDTLCLDISVKGRAGRGLWAGLTPLEAEQRAMVTRALIRYSWGTSEVCEGADLNWRHIKLAMLEAVSSIPAPLFLATRLRAMPRDEFEGIVASFEESNEDPEAVANLTEEVLAMAPDQDEEMVILNALQAHDAGYPLPLPEAEETLSSAPPGSYTFSSLTLRCAEGRILKSLETTVKRLTNSPAAWMPPVLQSKGGIDSATWP